MPFPSDKLINPVVGTGTMGVPMTSWVHRKLSERQAVFSILPVLDPLQQYAVLVLPTGKLLNGLW